MRPRSHLLARVGVLCLGLLPLVSAVVGAALGMALAGAPAGAALGAR